MAYYIHKKIADQANFYNNQKSCLLLCTSVFRIIFLKIGKILYQLIKKSITKNSFLKNLFLAHTKTSSILSNKIYFSPYQKLQF